jgi:hypothetical protein
MRDIVAYDYLHPRVGEFSQSLNVDAVEAAPSPE